MNVTLSWDLVAIIFVAVIVTYGFIIGKHESVKLVVASYVTTLAVQGIGNILERLLGNSSPLLRILGLPLDVSVLSLMKLFLFIAIIITLAIRAGLRIEYEKEPGALISVLATFLVSSATAVLMLTAILTFIAGTPLLDPALASAPPLAPLLRESTLIPLLTENQNLWFSLPALLLLAVGFLHKE